MADSPERLVATLDRLRIAGDGGVLIHCFAGRDRAGLAVAVLLDLLEVAHEQIIADHRISFAGDQAVESAQGLEPSTGGELPLSRRRHAEIMNEFLATGPARRCFASDSAVSAMRSDLIGRLVPGGGQTTTSTV